MATVINNPGGPDRVLERDSGAGWAVAAILIVAVIAGGAYLLMRYGNGAGADADTNIDVTVPTPNVEVPAPDTYNGTQ
jgi:hypothetical protein